MTDTMSFLDTVTSLVPRGQFKKTQSGSRVCKSCMQFTRIIKAKTCMFTPVMFSVFSLKAHTVPYMICCCIFFYDIVIGVMYTILKSKK